MISSTSKAISHANIHLVSILKHFQHVVVPPVKNDFESSTVLLHSTSRAVSYSIGPSRECLNVIHDPLFNSLSKLFSQPIIRSVVLTAIAVILGSRLLA